MGQTRKTSAAARWIDGAAQVLIGATAIVAACIALTGAGLRPPAESPAGRFRVAMQAYEAQQWPLAYAQLSAAADEGDASAARVAALMARQGPSLFGQRFDASQERLQRWDRATGVRPVVAPVTSRETDARTADSPSGVQVARAR
jgi:hypothetical protein